MRRGAGWGLLVVALLCLLVGAALAVLLGPDDRVRSDPQALDSDASLLVTATGAISWAGPAVRIDATLPGERRVFVGLGNAVDVSDYTDGVAARVIDTIEVPLDLGTREIGGDPVPLARPSSLDWWLVSDQARGSAGVTAQLPAAPAQLLVAAADGGDLRGLEVRASVELDGGFGMGIGLVGLAIGLVLFAWIALRRPDGSSGHAGSGYDEDRSDDSAAAGRSDVRSNDDGTVRRLGGAAGGLLLLAGMAGCSVPSQVDDEPSKLAVTRSEADGVLARWAERRAEALQQLDPDVLVGVEAGDTLAVDRGALTVARRLVEQGPPPQLTQQLNLRSVVAPRLSAYPLWFLAVVDDGERGLTKVQVYIRRSAAAPWLLVETAEVLLSTRLPDLVLDSGGALEPVAPDDSTGLRASPQDVADAYADLLADDESADDGLVLVDSFVQQMRSAVQTIRATDGVRLSQRWRADQVRWAARTRDGGSLVFATMRRDDQYRIEPSAAVDWAEGSEQAAFLAGRARTSAVLHYRHQVLLYVPAQGGGQVRALGQYGGVVSASGT